MDQSGLKRNKDLPVSASWMLRLNVCAPHLLFNRSRVPSLFYFYLLYVCSMVCVEGRGQLLEVLSTFSWVLGVKLRSSGFPKLILNTFRVYTEKRKILGLNWIWQFMCIIPALRKLHTKELFQRGETSQLVKAILPSLVTRVWFTGFTW